MKKKEKKSLLHNTLSLALRGITLVALAKKISALLKWEAEMAGKSLVLIITMSFLLVTLITFGWLCVLTLLFLCLHSFEFGVPIALFIIFVVNTAMIMSFYFLISHFKKDFVLRMKIS